MEENIDWLFDDPLPCVDMSGSNHRFSLKTEVKCEAGCEEQVPDGTGVKAESTVKEEVQVKVEREDKASVMQCLCLSASADCDACVLCERAEASSEGGCAGLEGEKYKRRLLGNCYMQPCVLFERVPETGLGNVGSLGLAQGEQCMEGVGVCQQEQAVARPASCGRCVWCPVVKVEGGGVCGSVCVKEEEERRDVEREDVIQPLVPMEDCKVEVKSVSCEEAGVEMLGEGEEQEVEGGVRLQARTECSVATGVRWSVCGAQWSEGSSAPVASSSSSSSSSPDVSELRPCVSSVETAQLTPLEKEQCSPCGQQQPRKRARVQSASSVVPQEARESSSTHPNVRTVREGLRRHACPHCEYKCAWRSKLKAHVETVHEGLRKYPCPQCQYKASWKVHLQTHIETVHEGLKKYPCPHCQYGASQRSHLQEHIESVHEGLKKYPCPHCHYEAGQKQNLKRHIDTVHEVSRKYPCPQCQFKASQKIHLQTHIETVHEGLKKYPCPHCQYGASQRNHLQTHIERVHEGSKKYPCPHCQYRAGVKGDLKKHIDTVHEGLRKYPCPHCQYRAGQTSHLQEHIKRVHEGSKKYPCSHCQYRARAKADLKKHIDLVHEGLRNYPCNHCQYRAGQKCTLERHIDTVHEGLR